MPKLTETIWNSLSEEIKNKIINSIDETLHFEGIKKYSSKIYKPFGHKPKIRQLSSGRYVLTNTCVTWSLRDDFEIAIDWCEVENKKHSAKKLKQIENTIASEMLARLNAMTFFKTTKPETLLNKIINVLCIKLPKMNVGIDFAKKRRC